jgi:hypothetical protein
LKNSNKLIFADPHRFVKLPAYSFLQPAHPVPLSSRKSRHFLPSSHPAGDTNHTIHPFLPK